MSDIEVYESTSPLPAPMLDRSEMNALFKLAKALSDTSFAPQAFRGKPWECLAAILTGRERRHRPHGISHPIFTSSRAAPRSRLS